MKVIVTGATGLLGQQVVKEYKKRGYKVFPLTRKDLDITNYEAVKTTIGAIKPDLVINCAAYTDVDKAESETEAAYCVNGLGPRLLANACRVNNAVLVQISTDYVFNGKSERPYLVSDTPDPINVYGTSKLMGEQGVRESGCLFYIVRTSWLFGPGGKNFVDTILKLAQENDTIRVVNDQKGCPTYTPDLARAIADLTATELYGTYHITNAGATTRYEWAKKIIESAGLKTKIEPCGSSEFMFQALRPRNSALDSYPTSYVPGCTMISWQIVMEQYLKIRARS